MLASLDIRARHFEPLTNDLEKYYRRTHTHIPQPRSCMRARLVCRFKGSGRAACVRRVVAGILVSWHLGYPACYSGGFFFFFFWIPRLLSSKAAAFCRTLQGSWVMYRRSKVFVRGWCVSCGKRARRLGWYRLCDVCRGLLSTFYVWFAWLVDLVMS